MVGNRRGISAKDLRPFSVDDPLGEKGAQRGSAAWAASPQRRGEEPASSGAQTITPEQARKVARYGCFLPMILIWAIGLLAGAGAWLPQLFEEIKPVLEAIVTRFEVELRGADGRASTPTVQSSAPPSAADPAEPFGADAPMDAPPDRGAPTNPSPLDAAQVELERVCARTVACCLTVQGERARTLCENFRHVPLLESCQQAYEAFAQVGRQLGHPCQE